MAAERSGGIFKYFLIVLLLLFSAGGVVKASSGEQTDMKALKKAFTAFQYKKVVQLADSLLRNRSRLSQKDVLEILRMKAIAYYVLDQNEMAVLTFIEILKIKPDYQLDPLNNSPKIIRFFESIRKNYLKNRQPQTTLPAKKEKGQIVSLRQWQTMRSAMYKSMIWPGLGHLLSGQKGKGAFLMIASLLSASASGYLIWQTHVLEERYLNAVEQADIDRKYKKYDQSYRLRNAALISYGVLWLYAQYDLSVQLSKTQKLSLQIEPSVLHRKAFVVNLNYTF